jgi:hypothetical protein
VASFSGGLFFNRATVSKRHGYPETSRGSNIRSCHERSKPVSARDLFIDRLVARGLSPCGRVGGRAAIGNKRDAGVSTNVSIAASAVFLGSRSKLRSEDSGKFRNCTSQRHVRDCEARSGQISRLKAAADGVVGRTPQE